MVDPLGHCQDGAKYFPKHLIEGRAALPIFLIVDLFTNKTTFPSEKVKDVTFYVMGSDDSTARYAVVVLQSIAICYE